MLFLVEVVCEGSLDIGEVCLQGGGSLVCHGVLSEAVEEILIYKRRLLLKLKVCRRGKLHVLGGVGR